jgi:tetratricopeptide (TPR) repeat protein
MLPTTKAKKLVVEGRRLYREGEYKEALAVFEEASSIDPTNGSALYEISFLGYELATKKFVIGEFSGALPIIDFERFLSGANEAHRLGDMDALQFSTQLQLNKYALTGISMLDADIPDILAYYEAKCKELESPLAQSGLSLVHRSWTFHYFGMVLAAAKEYYRAVGAFEKSIALNPDHFHSLFVMSKVFDFDVGIWPHAVHCAEECLRLRPGFKPARDLLQLIRETMKADIDMVQVLREGTVGVVKPGQIPVLTSQISGLRAEYKIRCERLLLEFERDVMPRTELSLTGAQVAASFYRYGLLSNEEEDYDAALEAYKKALTFDPPNIDIQVSQAWSMDLKMHQDKVNDPSLQGDWSRHMFFGFHSIMLRDCFREVEAARARIAAREDDASAGNIEDEDEEWTDCSEGEDDCLSEDMGVDDDGGSIGFEGGGNDEEQGNKEFLHGEMVDDFD